MNNITSIEYNEDSHTLLATPVHHQSLMSWDPTDILRELLTWHKYGAILQMIKRVASLMSHAKKSLRSLPRLSRVRNIFPKNSFCYLKLSTFSFIADFLSTCVSSYICKLLLLICAFNAIFLECRILSW